jgi:uncharacterized protein (DUF2267 family)
MTTTTHVPALEHTVHTTNAWLGEVAAELDSDDRQYAYRALRALLHALRDRLTIDETAQLAAQLPDLLRGVYYEGWDPSATPTRSHTAEQFLDRVAAEGAFHGHTEASFAAAAAMVVLRSHVSRGELDDVAAILPHDIRDLLFPAGR